MIDHSDNHAVKSIRSYDIHVLKCGLRTLPTRANVRDQVVANSRHIGNILLLYPCVAQLFQKLLAKPHKELKVIH